jgi:hypothetical protein
MNPATARTPTVRAPPRGWTFDASTGLLTLVDAFGWPETFLVLDEGRGAFELVGTGGDFGRSLLVLLDGRDSLCSCPDGEADRPCPHRLALSALARNRRNPLLP